MKWQSLFSGNKYGKYFKMSSAKILHSMLNVKQFIPNVLQNGTYDTYANSVDPDETARNEPSHQDIYCLPFCF